MMYENLYSCVINPLCANDHFFENTNDVLSGHGK